MEFMVYILYSQSTGKYYCGQTQNMEERLYRHNTGRNKSTKLGIPWKIIHSISCSNRADALELEKKIKGRGIKRFLEINFNNM